MNPLQIVDLGLISYADAYVVQQRVVAARKARLIEDVLLFCEHRHVITLGRNGKRENLLASDHVLRQKNVEFHATNRGGDITYHGPGQIVGYLILDLSRIQQDVHWYVRTLEEVMIRSSAHFAVTAYRVASHTTLRQIFAISISSFRAASTTGRPRRSRSCSRARFPPPT